MRGRRGVSIETHAGRSKVASPGSETASPRPGGIRQRLDTAIGRLTTLGFKHLPRVMFHSYQLGGANYEREMELLDALCDRNATSVDVGAKVGMYTYRMLDRSSDVIAFEPIPLLHRYLRAAFRDARVRIEPYALSDRDGHAVLRVPFDVSGRHLFGRSTIDDHNSLAYERIARVEPVDIPVRRLDDYEFSALGFIKIDVEGHELAVLEGAEKTIEAHRPNLLVECNDEHQPDRVAKLATWLDERDYDGYFLYGRELLPMIIYNRDIHWTREHVENFICIHSSRPRVTDHADALAQTASLRPRDRRPWSGVK